MIPLYSETCRCEKRLTTNWRVYTPYVAPNQMGMLPPIVEDFAVSCCKTCKSHGRSYVDWLHNGKNTSSEQNDAQKIKEYIEYTDLNFPIYGWTWQENYERIYRFVDKFFSILVALPAVLKVQNKKITVQKNPCQK